MKLVLVAVGQRQPAWADAAFADHQRRGRDLSSVLRRGTSIVLYTLDVQPASGKPSDRRTGATGRWAVVRSSPAH